jgi:hypothetical protein
MMISMLGVHSVDDAMINDWRADGGMTIGRGNWSSGRNLTSVPHSAPQTAYEFSLDRTRASSVRSSWISARVLGQALPDCSTLQEMGYFSTCHVNGWRSLRNLSLWLTDVVWNNKCSEEFYRKVCVCVCGGPPPPPVWVLSSGVAVVTSMGCAEWCVATSNLGYYLMVCGNNQLSVLYLMVCGNQQFGLCRMVCGNKNQLVVPNGVWSPSPIWVLSTVVWQ